MRVLIESWRKGSDVMHKYALFDVYTDSDFSVLVC